LNLKTRYVGLESLDKFSLAFLMNLTGNILTLYTVFQSLTTASANCDYGTVAQRMGTLFKQLLDFNKDLIGVTPVRLLMATRSEKTEFYQQAEVVFNWVRDSMKSMELKIKEDFALREIEARQKGPLAQMDEVLQREIKPLQKHKYTSAKTTAAASTLPLFSKRF
jgi:hypothetical protein